MRTDEVAPPAAYPQRKMEGAEPRRRTSVRVVTNCWSEGYLPVMMVLDDAALERVVHIICHW
jgi:hypothetical protein